MNLENNFKKNIDNGRFSRLYLKQKQQAPLIAKILLVQKVNLHILEEKLC